MKKYKEAWPTKKEIQRIGRKNDRKAWKRYMTGAYGKKETRHGKV